MAAPRNPSPTKAAANTTSAATAAPANAGIDPNDVNTGAIALTTAPIGPGTLLAAPTNDSIPALAASVAEPTPLAFALNLLKISDSDLNPPDDALVALLVLSSDFAILSWVLTNDFELDCIMPSSRLYFSGLKLE